MAKRFNLIFEQAATFQHTVNTASASVRKIIVIPIGA